MYRESSSEPFGPVPSLLEMQTVNIFLLNPTTISNPLPRPPKSVGTPATTSQSKSGSSPAPHSNSDVISPLFTSNTLVRVMRVGGMIRGES